MTARDEILTRLRPAADPAVPMPEPPRLSEPVPVAELTSLFIERAKANGTEVETVTQETLANAVIDELTKAKVSRIAIWEDRLLAQLRAALRAWPVEVLDPWDHGMESVAGADAGITVADFAIALTGTLVLDCSPSHPRSTSLLPPLHLAVVLSEHIVSTVGDVLARTGPLPSALTFVSGPSRTADIELTPVRGAHGPTRVKVFLLL